MAPGIALDDLPHRCWGHGVRIGKLLDTEAFSVGFADRLHLLGGQLGAARAFAPRLAMLRHFVGDVGGMGAEKEMAWVDTARVIAVRAVVQDIQSIGNRTVS